MMKTPRSTTRSILACSVLLAAGVALAQGCASTASAPAKQETAAKMSPESAPPSDAAMQPYPSVTSAPKDIETEEKALDDAEKELLSAIDNKKASGEPLDTSDRCSVVCKALASMQRSAKQVCSLAADRCNAANERLKSATERAKAACPACSTPT
ncbi:MAG: hypothetical protein HOW73_38725 [Polyangiaceae bacterium]|nr:hypothetical protein [Polyangiaceae bacterium]